MHLKGILISENCKTISVKSAAWNLSIRFYAFINGSWSFSLSPFLLTLTMFKKKSSLSLWQFEKLNFHNLIHYVSGRDGGESSGEKGGLNLSYHVGDDPEIVSENRRRLASALDIDISKLIFPQQTHSLNVKYVTQDIKGEDLIHTDAIFTDCKGICISVMSADCVPILLYDPSKGVIAAVHSGWKGTVGKILSRTVKAMQDQFDCLSADLIVCIGPSICPEVYEVGEEVISSVKNAFDNTNGLVTGENGSGKGFLNLWEANKRQLIELGVPELSIEVAGICTYKQSETFFSARRSKNQAGRFAAGIMMK
jgi:polyphenol oxidase